VRLSDVDLDEFEQLAERAFDDLPPWVEEALEDLAVLVEDRASPADSPHGGQLLGLFRGVARTRRGGPVAGQLPSTITLYREPIVRLSADRDDLVQRVRSVLQHEVGHALGMSEERLRELGVG